MKNIAVPDIWNADIYSRLSKEDRRKDGKAKDESNSIKNQRDLLLDFVNNNPDIRVAHILADDGATGADFDREDFKTMIAHIESGEVNCVIVKDENCKQRIKILCRNFCEPPARSCAY